MKLAYMKALNVQWGTEGKATDCRDRHLLLTFSAHESIASMSLSQEKFKKSCSGKRGSRSIDFPVGLTGALKHLCSHMAGWLEWVGLDVTLSLSTCGSKQISEICSPKGLTQREGSTKCIYIYIHSHRKTSDFWQLWAATTMGALNMAHSDSISPISCVMSEGPARSQWGWINILLSYLEIVALKKKILGV